MIVLRNGFAGPAGTVASPLVANLDAGGNKVTNVDDGTNPGDAVNLGQLDAADALAVHLAGAETVTGAKTFSAAFKLATYTVATLPAATVRQIAYVSDALKDGETTGNGTGTVAYADGTIWARLSDDTEVEA